MYDEVKTTNTCAWMKLIPNSKPQIATTNANGIKPKIKKITPEVIML